MRGPAHRRAAADARHIAFCRPRKTGHRAVLAMLALAAGIAAVDGAGAAPTRAQQIPGIDARIVAHNIPGASALAQVGTFLTTSACGHPIPSNFPAYIQPGAVLDPNRLLVGSTSNFGAPLPSSGGLEGSFLSIDPNGEDTLIIPPNFARNGQQVSALGGAVQMFSANSPHWLNRVNNPGAFTAQYTGVGNPLGLSNNNAFGRIWPANSPFGLDQAGSSSILDPTGLPLKGAPNAAIGGVYFGNLTNRNAVTTPSQAQVIAGGLNMGAVGTALLGPSPDGTCKAVFAVVTADGAIVQEHTLKGLDGLASPGDGSTNPRRRQGWPGPSYRAPVRGNHERIHPSTRGTAIVRQRTIRQHHCGRQSWHHRDGAEPGLHRHICCSHQRRRAELSGRPDARHQGCGQSHLGEQHGAR